MLTSTALVLMMTIPGLALFYGGMVRKKNVLATLMQSFAITCVVTLLWWLIGYSWAFTPGSPYLGGSSRALLNGIGNQNGPAHIVEQREAARVTALFAGLDRLAQCR